MSRYSIATQDNVFAYGFDHASGYFFQIYEKKDHVVAEFPSIDKDSSTGLSRADFVKELSKWAVPQPHLTAAILDLSF